MGLINAHHNWNRLLLFYTVSTFNELESNTGVEVSLSWSSTICCDSWQYHVSNMNYWVMLYFQELLSIFKIKFWCELTIATTCLGKCGSLFWSKIYIDTLKLGQRGQDLDSRLTFRIEFLIFDWPVRWMVTKRTMGIRDREFRHIARDSFSCKKNFVLEYYSRYVSHMSNSCVFRYQIFKYTETGTLIYKLKTLVCLKIKSLSIFLWRKLSNKK